MRLLESSIFSQAGGNYSSRSLFLSNNFHGAFSITVALVCLAIDVGVSLMSILAKSHQVVLMK